MSKFIFDKSYSEEDVEKVYGEPKVDSRFAWKRSEGGVHALTLSVKYNPEFQQYNKSDKFNVFIAGGDGNESYRVDIINSIKDQDIFDVFLFVNDKRLKFIGRYSKVRVLYPSDQRTKPDYDEIIEPYNRRKNPLPLEYTQGCNYIEMIMEIIKVEKIIENLKKYNTDLLLEEIKQRGYQQPKLDKAS